MVNTSTATYEILPFLGDVINEMECDNSSYAVSKYGTLPLDLFNSNKSHADQVMVQFEIDQES